MEGNVNFRGILNDIVKMLYNNYNKTKRGNLIMKMKKIWFLFCLVILMAMPVHSVNAEDVDEEDELPIVIESVNMNKSSVKKGETLTYEIVLSPVKEVLAAKQEEYDGEKLTSILLFWKSSGKQRISREYKWDGKDTLTIKDGIKVEKGMQPGKWKLQSIFLNYNDWYGFNVHADDYISKKPLTNPIYADFSMAKFSVTGTKADNKAPVMNWNSMKRSKSRVTSKQSSKFSIKVTDSSRIRKVESCWKVFYKDRKKHNRYGYVYIPMKYNKSKKCYECNVKLGKKYKKAVLDEIIASDIHGNECFRGADMEHNPELTKKLQKITVVKK